MTSYDYNTSCCNSDLNKLQPYVLTSVPDISGTLQKLRTPACRINPAHTALSPRDLRRGEFCYAECGAYYMAGRVPAYALTYLRDLVYAAQVGVVLRTADWNPVLDCNWADVLRFVEECFMLQKWVQVGKK